MKCGYCGKEIEPEDQNYGKIQMHFNCMVTLQDDMVKHGLIRIKPCRMSYSLTKRFEKLLNRTMNHTRLHITRDNTIDEDLIDMQGVIRTIGKYVSNPNIDSRVLFLFSEIIFNGLMTEKYGFPLPDGKDFSSRFKEFVTEVYSLEMNEEEFNLFKKILKK